MVDLSPAKLEWGFLSSHCSPEAVSEAVQAGVSEDSFQIHLNQEIWRYCVQRMESGETLTPQDVNARFEAGLDENLTDREIWLNDLMSVTIARRVRTILADQLEMIDRDPVKTVQNIVLRLGDVHHPASSKTVYYDKDVLERLAAYKDMRDNGKESDKEGVFTGLKLFDDKLGKFREGEVVAIIGRPNVGKSGLLTHFCAESWLQGKRILYLSPESPVNDIQARIDALMARKMGYGGFTVRDITQHRAGRDYEVFLEALSEKERGDLLIRDSGEMGSFSITDVLAYAREYKPDILAIDGFHLIDTGDESWQAMKKSAQAVKGLALSMKMIILAVSQVQRDAVQSPDEVPGMGKSAYGMGLEETCDKLIAIADKRGAPLSRVWKLIKNRNGPTELSRQYLQFDINQGIIGDLDIGDIDDLQM